MGAADAARDARSACRSPLPSPTIRTAAPSGSRSPEPSAPRRRIVCGRSKEAAIGEPEAESGHGPADLQDHRDRELLARTAGGDEDAFVELYRRYGAAAHGLALRVTGDRASAEDVVQEVFVSVWRRAGSYDPGRGTARSWLLAQVHHRAVDAVRREEAQRRRAIPGEPPAAADPDDIVEGDWLAARRLQVRAALGRLEPDQRTVLELAYFGALTQSQVAERLGIPLGTVKSRTLAALRRLRPLVGGMDP